MFFIDSGAPTAQSQTVALPGSSGNDDHLQHESSAPVWVDSDDERIVVSLASDPRLRKLRLSEAEDWINGGEYTRRLRQQFERLYPVPKWANPPPRRKRSRKKQKRAGCGSASSDTDGLLSDGSVDSEGLSAKPLSELLQNTSLLLGGPATSFATRRTLRAEVVDVQRSKDVGNAQAVSFGSRILDLTDEHLVGNHILRVSPHTSSPSLFRFCFYSISPSYLAQSTASKSPSDITPCPSHSYCDVDL